MASLRTQNRLTRLGYHFAFVGAFAGLGGSIRGLNLLLVLAGLAAAVLLVQWRLCRRMGEALRGRRDAPELAFAGEPFLFVYHVFNTSRFTRARWIRLFDRISFDLRSARDSRPDAMRRTTSGRVRGISPGGFGNSRSPNSASPGKVVIPVDRVEPDDCRRIASTMVIRHRGRYRLGRMELSTTFPFCLMTATSTNVPPDSPAGIGKSKVVNGSQTLWVAPRRVRLRPDWTRLLVAGAADGRVGLRRETEADGEFHGLREWHRGDTLRQIHWRTSARIGRPAVQLTRQARGIEYCLVIDAFVPEGAGRNEIEALERTLCVAITMVSPPAAGKAVCRGVVVAGRSSDASDFTGESFLRDRSECAKRLAVECGASSADLAEALRTARKATSMTCRSVVVSTRTAVQAGFGPAGVAASRNGSRGPRRTRESTAPRRSKPSRQPCWLSTADGSIDRLIVNDGTPGAGEPIDDGACTTNPAAANLK